MRVAEVFLALTLAAGLTGDPVASPSPPPILRFHHIHYRAGDPAAAMNAAARRLEGVRVIVQGLGVGVRSGREFLLFDRAGVDDARRGALPAQALYPLAVERLTDWGFQVEPATASQVRVASALAQLPADHLAFVAEDFEAAVQRLVDAGVPVLSRRDDAVMFDAGGGLTLEIVCDTDREETFWCPMHLDVRSADEGNCPICGMGLVPIPPPRIGEYNLDVAQVLERGRSSGLRLAVREPDTNALVQKFAVVHEKLLHLFVVSRDLTYFAHVHPDLQPDGTFALSQVLLPGEYMLIADFLPEGGTSQMVQKAIIVTGKGPAARSSDDSNGLSVRLHTEDLAAGKHVRLTFTVTDARSGEPVTDLEPYLGAPAHMLIVRADLSDAIHAHPEELVTSGPTVSFHPIMPAAGEYKGWIQFQRRGRVSTTAFELRVQR